MGPVAFILEEGEKGVLTPEKATRVTLRFIGNAQKSNHRTDELIELAEKDSIYENTLPLLFGYQFAKERRTAPLPRQGLESWQTPVFSQLPPSGPTLQGQRIPAVKALTTGMEGVASTHTITSSGPTQTTYEEKKTS